MKRKLLQHHLQRLIALPMVNIVEFYETLDSTNQMAMETIACSRTNTCSDAEGYLVFCDQQTAGKGRGNNQWFSPPGGLYFSLTVGEVYPPAISLIAALSLVQSLESQAGIDTKIKWPNDILWKDRKIAGILIQTIDDHTIIGMGINTFSDEVEADLECYINVHLPDLNRRIDLMIEIINKLSDNIDLLKTDGFSHLKNKIEGKMAWLGDSVSLELGNETTKGQLKGIDDEGRILIGEGKTGSISGTLRRI